MLGYVNTDFHSHDFCSEYTWPKIMIHSELKCFNKSVSNPNDWKTHAKLLVERRGKPGVNKFVLLGYCITVPIWGVLETYFLKTFFFFLINLSQLYV